MNSFVYINGIKYDAPKIMEEIMNHPPGWKLKGLEFLMQLLDPSGSPVKFHTSGTTGTPKEIAFSKKQILHSAQNTCTYFGIHPGSQLLLTLPAHLVAGRLMIARALVSGAQLVWVEPSLDPIKHITKIDFAAFTPAQVSMMLENPESRTQLKNIQQTIIGGGEISHLLETELKKIGSTIYATYGMTETLTHVAVRKIGEDIYHSVYPEAQFTVNNESCLEISLPFISASKLITSDMVELIGPQSFQWKGRKDHVINSGGLKIHPEQVEAKLIASGILKEGQFYITSKTDPVFGQSPVIVLLKDKASDDMAIFLTKLNELLNKHEALKAVIIFDKFEYTENGKLKRQKFV